MNNWQYANEIPTAPWRGAMTIPRTVSLRNTPEGLRLAQAPIAGIEGLRGRRRTIAGRAVPAGQTRLADDGIEGLALEIIAEFEPGEAGSFGLKVRQGNDEETTIGVDRRAGEVFIDRGRSGSVGFSPQFPGRHSARRAIGDQAQPIRLHVLVDATSVEVFADGGQVALTDQIFPDPAGRGVSLFATGGAARLRSLDVWDLRP